MIGVEIGARQPAMRIDAALRLDVTNTIDVAWCARHYGEWNMEPGVRGVKEQAARGPQWVRDAVRDVVSEVAPDELLLVNALRRLDDDSAVRRLSHIRQRREPLGFGLAEVAVLVTPVVWIALDEVVRMSVEAGVQRTRSRVGSWLRARLGRGAPPRSMPVLTGEQLRAVRDRIRELAVAGGTEPEAAAVLADRVVARLATATDDDLPPSRPADRRGR
ncbi:hypothetical protein [Micromonospora haikouensis]|uniref:hypothetical protein n=1 Tax=Micromonospora haikouensis TaxID=686309 RepID=UPI003D8F6917